MIEKAKAISRSMVKFLIAKGKNMLIIFRYQLLLIVMASM
jgi:hypothetical protein